MALQGKYPGHSVGELEEIRDEAVNTILGVFAGIETTEFVTHRQPGETASLVELCAKRMKEYSNNPAARDFIKKRIIDKVQEYDDKVVNEALFSYLIMADEKGVSLPKLEPEQLRELAERYSQREKITKMEFENLIRMLSLDPFYVPQLLTLVDQVVTN